MVANSEMEQYELQEDGADFNIGAGSGAMSFEMPYERKKRPPKGIFSVWQVLYKVSKYTQFGLKICKKNCGSTKSSLP